MQVKDFAPGVFAQIRNLFGRPKEFYLTSWSDSNLLSQRLFDSSRETFLVSPDRRYVLQIISKAQSKFLRVMLGMYFKVEEEEEERGEVKQIKVS
jgi:hypothetical protein